LSNSKDGYKEEDNKYFSKIRNFVYRGGKHIGEKDIEAYHLENLQLRETLNKFKIKDDESKNRLKRLEDDNYLMVAKINQFEKDNFNLMTRNNTVTSFNSDTLRKSSSKFEMREFSRTARSRSQELLLSDTTQRGFILRSEANNYKKVILDYKNKLANQNVAL